MDGIAPKALQEMEAVKEMIARDDHMAARDKLLELQRQFPCIDGFSIAQAASEQDVEFQYNKISTHLKLIKTHTPAAESALKIVEEVVSNTEKRSNFDKKRTTLFETWEVLNVQQIHDTTLTEHIVQSNEINPTPTKSEMAAFLATSGTDNVGNSKDSRLNTLRDENACVKRDVNFAATRPSNSSLFLKGCDQQHFSFNSIKSCKLFQGQVWAAYDDECMPRNYFQIDEIDKNPLRFYVNCLRAAQPSSYELFRGEMDSPIVCGLFNVGKNETKLILPAMLSHIVCSHASKQVQIHPKEHEVWAMYTEWDPMIKCSNDEARKKCKLEVVEIVTGYSKSENILAARLDKVDDFENVFRRPKRNGQEQVLSITSDNLYNFSHRIPAHRFVGGDMEGMLELDPYAIPSDLDSPESITGKAPSYTETKSCEPENKCSLKDVASNQIWAVRDNPEAMPRRYVVVNNVTPEGEIFVTFLEPNLTCADEKRWVEQGLPLACGSFDAGKTTRVLGVYQFSHVMRFEQSQEDSSFRIYPNKGEVWAMYGNWNCKWDQSDFTCCRYRIVEIIADLADGSEILVARLVEVSGFMSLFQRQHYNRYELIHRADFLSFSHRIDASRVQATKDNGISTPFWHLEPDSLGSFKC